VNAAKIRVDDCAGPGLQASRNLEDRSEGTPFPGNAMVRRDDPMQDALLVGDKEVLEVDGGAGDDGWRLI